MYINLQKTNRILSIIGRRKESFLLNKHNEYMYFGYNFKIIHKLKYFIDQLKSNNIQKQFKIIKNMKNYYVEYKNIEVIMRAGLIPIFIKICKNNDNININ